MVIYNSKLILLLEAITSLMFIPYCSSNSSSPSPIVNSNKKKFSDVNSKKRSKWSVTEYTKGRARPDELIFQDEFNSFDLETWSHVASMSYACGISEFQMYTNNRSNSYVKYGKLFIKPTLTVGKYGASYATMNLVNSEGEIYSSNRRLDALNACQILRYKEEMLKPILSAKITTKDSFAFKYGKVECRAKLPRGDWIKPIISFLPKYDQYGTWPASGQIDWIISRGNGKLYNERGVNVGTRQTTSTLHFGPFPAQDAWENAQFKKNIKDGFDQDFHIFQLEWTPVSIKFLIDGELVGTVAPSDTGGFWEFGKFDMQFDNPWIYGENYKMTPFDQKFFLVISLDVGGTNGFWDDNFINEEFNKPWNNTSHRAILDFWEGKEDWLSTWEGENSSFVIDYIRIWSL